MNPLQRAAFIRKVYYISAVLVLFTLSMFWRGIIPIPLSGSARAAESRGGIQRAADRLNSYAILNKARSLDLRELEQGDVDIAGSSMQLGLSLVGSRGAATSYLWYMAMDKQKRNDFHEMEQLIQLVTRLQPHFLTPWIYQSWNISYNVSVEMQGSGDMYHYIARGIDLLAEGERRNNHVYEGANVGSPDMRYWIAFYYQNKFGVSDQVEVLRCLFELSCMSPDERNPDAYIDKQTSAVDLAKFREFCRKYPHLVRRLRGEDPKGAGSDELTRKKVQEALKCPTPEIVIQFLRENRDVPSRYESARKLADPERQFPVLPPKFNEGPNEAHPGSGEDVINDDFTAYLAARAWYVYSLAPVPPNPLDSYDEPLPSGSPRPAARIGEIRPGEYDPFRYRVPRQPMLIIFRQGPPRSQTAHAEQEQREGWFDNEGWRIDDPGEGDAGKWWFPDPEAPAGSLRPLEFVVGRERDWSLDAWQKAAQMWTKHGQENGLILSNERLQRYEGAAQGGGASMPADPNEQELVDLAARRRYEAKAALFYYGSNRSVTNFAYFLASSQAEAQRETVNARKLLWQAEQARKLGRTFKAIELYEKGLKEWKGVLARNPDFHRPDRSDRTEEETAEYEMAYVRLLVQDDQRVRDRANEWARQITFSLVAAGKAFPCQLFPADPKLLDQTRNWKTDALEGLKLYVAAEEFSPFAKVISEADGVSDRARLGTPWVREGVKNNVRTITDMMRGPRPPAPSKP